MQCVSIIECVMTRVCYTSCTIQQLGLISRYAIYGVKKIAKELLFLLYWRGTAKSSITYNSDTGSIRIN